MDTLFEKDGIEMIRWTDENGNIWTAEYEDVKWFGKECFESFPMFEDGLWNWSVEFNLPEDDEELIEVDNWQTEEVLVMSRKAFDKWCREQEIC